jgi:hypothetical protein
MGSGWGATILAFAGLQTGGGGGTPHNPPTARGTMAGLGLFFHESGLALAPRGLLRSAYDFLCLIYAKLSRASWNGPGQFRPTLGSYTQKTFFGPPIEALVRPFSIQKKPSQKHQNLTSVG